MRGVLFDAKDLNTLINIRVLNVLKCVRVLDC